MFLRFLDSDRETNPATGSTPPAEAQKTEIATEHMIPKSRFDEVNRELRELRKAQADAESVRKAAEEKALAEQGEFRTLAEQRLAELTTAQAAIEAGRAVEKDRDRYKAALSKHLEGLRADLPAPILTLLDKLDAADQLEWIAENRASLVNKGDGVGSPAGGKRPQGKVEIPSPGARF